MASRARPGKTLGLGPPEGQAWVWQTSTMLGATTYQALGISARRILDFLQHEHASHGGRANGALCAPYKQLRAWGVTGEDVRLGFEELYLTGFVELTRQGLRQAGGGEPSRYALTWLPSHAGTADAMPPSHQWQRVLRRLVTEGYGDVVKVKRWLREQTAEHRRAGRSKQKVTPHLHLISDRISGARGRPQ